MTRQTPTDWNRQRAARIAVVLLLLVIPFAAFFVLVYALGVTGYGTIGHPDSHAQPHEPLLSRRDFIATVTGRQVANRPNPTARLRNVRCR